MRKALFVLMCAALLWGLTNQSVLAGPSYQGGESAPTATPRPTRIVTTATLTAEAAAALTGTATPNSLTQTAIASTPATQAADGTEASTPSDPIGGFGTPTPFVNITPVTIPTQQPDRPYDNPQMGLWSAPADLSDGETTNWRAFPIPVCDQYQNLHVFWADNENETSPAGFRAAFFYRNDVDGTLSVPADIVNAHEGNIHNPAVSIANYNDIVHLVWVSNPFGSLYHTSAPLAHAASASAWQSVQYIDNRVFYAAVESDGEHVHIIYGRSADETNETAELVHIQSEDGYEWSDPQVIYSRRFAIQTYFRPEMAIDQSGRIHVGLTIRSTTYGVASEVGYIRSPDGGKTWEPYRPIQTMGKAWQGVEWISPYAFGPNEIHLTWHDPERMHMESKDGGLTWTTPELIVPLGAAFGGATELAKDSAGVLHAIVAVQGGVYLVTKKNGAWGIPEEMDDRTIDMHGQRIAICQGNHIFAFGWDRTGPMTAWYWTRTLDAPSIPRSPIPTPAVVVLTLNPDETRAAEATPTNIINRPVSQQYSHTVENQSMATPLLISIAAAVLFMILIVTVIGWRQGR